MPDRFSSFEELCKVYVNGVDFSIKSRLIEGSELVVMAPHGGKIEPFTSELAAQVAHDNYSMYAFEGHLRNNNRDLHITSHVFFEPTLDSLLQRHITALAFHGRHDNGDPDTIFLGGLDGPLVSKVSIALSNAGFKVASEGHKFPGAHPRNSCNRCSSGMGVQFELPTSLRKMLSADPEYLEILVTAVRSVFLISSEK